MNGENLDLECGEVWVYEFDLQFDLGSGFRLTKLKQHRTETLQIMRAQFLLFSHSLIWRRGVRSFQTTVAKRIPLPELTESVDSAGVWTGISHLARRSLRRLCRYWRRVQCNTYLRPFVPRPLQRL